MDFSKKQLIDFFDYNDWANRKFLAVMQEITEKKELTALFSHLINAQDKWMNRIVKVRPDENLSWTRPAFPYEELEEKWRHSHHTWSDYLHALKEEELASEIVFYRQSDQKPMKVAIKDIAFQLNCHAIHHRGQMAKMIRAAGKTPPAADYILTAIKEA